MISRPSKFALSSARRGPLRQRSQSCRRPAHETRFKRIGVRLHGDLTRQLDSRIAMLRSLAAVHLHTRVDDERSAARKADSKLTSSVRPRLVVSFILTGSIRGQHRACHRCRSSGLRPGADHCVGHAQLDECSHSADRNDVHSDIGRLAAPSARTGGRMRRSSLRTQCHCPRRYL